MGYIVDALKQGRGGSQVRYQVLYVMETQTKTIDLKAVVGPGDQNEPVITIMLPNED